MMKIHKKEDIILAKMPERPYKTRMYGLKQANSIDLHETGQKSLQSFFLYGMISVVSYTHFEARINIKITRHVTFM